MGKLPAPRGVPDRSGGGDRSGGSEPPARCLGIPVCRSRRIVDTAGVAAASAASSKAAPAKAGAGLSAAPPVKSLPAETESGDGPPGRSPDHADRNGSSLNPDGGLGHAERDRAFRALQAQVEGLQAHGAAVDAQLREALAQLAGLRAEVAALKELKVPPQVARATSLADAPTPPLPLESGGGARPPGRLPPLAGAAPRPKESTPPLLADAAAVSSKDLLAPGEGSGHALVVPAAATAERRISTGEVFVEPLVDTETLGVELPAGAPWVCKQHELGEHDFFLSYRVWCDAQLAQTLFYALEAHRRPSDEAASAFLDQVCAAGRLTLLQLGLNQGIAPNTLGFILFRGMCL